MNFRKTIRDSNNAQLGFILAELSAGMTFASMARLDGEGKAKARRRALARAAYNSVTHFADRVPMTQEQSQEVRTTTAALKHELVALGERF